MYIFNYVAGQELLSGNLVAWVDPAWPGLPTSGQLVATQTSSQLEVYSCLRPIISFKRRLPLLFIPTISPWCTRKRRQNWLSACGFVRPLDDSLKKWPSSGEIRTRDFELSTSTSLIMVIGCLKLSTWRVDIKQLLIVLSPTSHLPIRIWYEATICCSDSSHLRWILKA